MAQLVKKSTCNAGDLGLIPELGRSPEEGKGYLLYSSDLENSMDCIIHGVLRVGHNRMTFTFMVQQSYIQVSENCSVVSDSLQPHGLHHTVHGVLQARILEWVAIPFSRGSSQTKDQTQISHIAGGFFTS